MDTAKPLVIVIVGATGSGKSDLGIRVAREVGGEVICADSRTVYRGMDIGTAKPTIIFPPLSASAGGGEVRRGGVSAESYQDAPPPPHEYIERGREIKHHLLDIRNPNEPYSVAEFQQDADACIRAIVEHGKVPIVVGGTMLYVRALVDWLNFARTAARPERRQELERMDVSALQQFLLELDPDAADVVDVANKRRLIRAIETVESVGVPLARARGTGEAPYRFLQIGLSVERDVLRERIAQRTHAMFADGLLDEVQRIRDTYGDSIEPLRGVVYRQCMEWVMHPSDDRVSQEELEQRINRELNRYARRQLAWFRKDARVRWVQDAGEAIALVKENVQ
ncbi:MAG: tRNA (adenosine(37)-N6)-dimethylallyltransferase MiaA [bacterium]|nr:tRNA (adenosine(37)-N6)-dimethylallyltransferase MiaA [bacterium]